MPFIRYLLRLYNLYLSPSRAFARQVRELTGVAPARLSIFRLAFAHKSNQHQRDPDAVAPSNNERLEYLGDAVLGTIVAEYLFKKYPNADEGFLTKMRSKIVKRKSLNYIGDQMGLDVLLTDLNHMRLSSSMLGNAVEALCGAVYLERGYEGTKRFVIRKILRLYVDVHELETTDDNYKSQLLEYCQKNGRSVAYKLVDKYKQDRRDRFKVGVVVDGKSIATADDFNKKAAEQLASRTALVVLGAMTPAAAAVAPTLAIKPTKAPAPATVKPRRKPPRTEEPSTKDTVPTPDLQPAATLTPARKQPRPKRQRRTKLQRYIDHAVATSAAATSLPHSPGPPILMKATESTSKQPLTEDSASAKTQLAIPKPSTSAPRAAASTPTRFPQPSGLTLLDSIIDDAVGTVRLSFRGQPRWAPGLWRIEQARKQAEANPEAKPEPKPKAIAEVSAEPKRVSHEHAADVVPDDKSKDHDWENQAFTLGELDYGDTPQAEHETQGSVEANEGNEDDDDDEFEGLSFMLADVTSAHGDADPAQHDDDAEQFEEDDDDDEEEEVAFMLAEAPEAKPKPKPKPKQNSRAPKPTRKPRTPEPAPQPRVREKPNPAAPIGDRDFVDFGQFGPKTAHIRPRYRGRGRQRKSE